MWTTEFYSNKNGLEKIVSKFRGFAEIHCTKLETVVYGTSGRMYSLEGDVKISKLEEIQTKIEENFNVLQLFSKQDAN